MKKTGTEGKQTVFLFSDNQIKDESFMEDISMILNTGDVPNIFPADEKADIIEKMQTVARNAVSVECCAADDDDNNDKDKEMVLMTMITMIMLVAVMTIMMMMW